MKRTVKVALIQFQSIMGDTQASTRKAIPMIEEAADNGAQIICLPELFSTGYNLGILGTKFPSMGEYIDGPTIQALQAVAREKKYISLLRSHFTNRNFRAFFSTALFSLTMKER